MFKWLAILKGMESKRTSIIMPQIVSSPSFNPHLLNYYTSNIEHMPTAENASGYSAPGKKAVKAELPFMEYRFLPQLTSWVSVPFIPEDQMVFMDFYREI